MYKLSSRFVIEELENKIVLLDTKTLLLFHLNETASFIVKRVIKKKNKEDIIQLLTESFDISQEKAKKDVEILIKDLLKKKVIYSLE